jgi:hypothetical protein
LPDDYGIEYLTSGLGSATANGHADHVADSGCGVAASDPALLQDGYHLHDLGAGVVDAFQASLYREACRHTAC